MNRTVLMFVVAIVAGVAAAQQIPPGPASSGDATVEAKGEIAGVVVSAKTGEPLRSARVMLQGGDRRGSRGGPANQHAFTGIDGRFFFAGLPPGDYGLSASKAGYGVRGNWELAAEVTLGQDGTRDDVVLRLQPAAVVTGRVWDASGEPLADASVSVIARSHYAGETRWRVMQSGETNDLGEYRLYGFGPGRYIIAVNPPRSPSPRGVAYQEFSGSFYPSADSPEQATVFPLSWGSEVTGIDFRLTPAPETTVQGIVIDGSSGEPCEECSIRIQDYLGGPSAFSVMPTREGIFLMRGVPAGPCWVIAFDRGPVGRRVAEPVVVPAAGAADVKLVVRDGQTVSGEVVLEDPPKQEEQTPQDEQARRRRQQGIFVGLQGRGPHMWGPPPRANAPAQGGPVEFRRLAPGSYRVQVRAANGGYLRAISIDGRELDRPEITVPSDASLSGLRLHVAFGGATIAGTVKGASDTASPFRGWILLIPEPGSNAYVDREYIATGQGTGPNEFRRPGIAPGRYTLYAVRRIDTFDVGDSEVRRALEPYAKRVTLRKGETATVELSPVPEAL